MRPWLLLLMSLVMPCEPTAVEAAPAQDPSAQTPSDPAPVAAEDAEPADWIPLERAL
ncbi:MAG: hypothetical protein ACI8PZ_001675 [Myxococcota bacterium]|jgi:hypothetical protein